MVLFFNPDPTSAQQPQAIEATVQEDIEQLKLEANIAQEPDPPMSSTNQTSILDALQEAKEDLDNSSNLNAPTEKAQATSSITEPTTQSQSSALTVNQKTIEFKPTNDVLGVLPTIEVNKSQNPALFNAIEVLNNLGGEFEYKDLGDGNKTFIIKYEEFEKRINIDSQQNWQEVLKEGIYEFSRELSAKLEAEQIVSSQEKESINIEQEKISSIQKELHNKSLDELQQILEQERYEQQIINRLNAELDPDILADFESKIDSASSDREREKIIQDRNRYIESAITKVQKEFAKEQAYQKRTLQQELRSVQQASPLGRELDRQKDKLLKFILGANKDFNKKESRLTKLQRDVIKRLETNNEGNILDSFARDVFESTVEQPNAKKKEEAVKFLRLNFSTAFNNIISATRQNYQEIPSNMTIGKDIFNLRELDLLEQQFQQTLSDTTPQSQDEIIKNIAQVRVERENVIGQYSNIVQSRINSAMEGQFSSLLARQVELSNTQLDIQRQQEALAKEGIQQIAEFRELAQEAYVLQAVKPKIDRFYEAKTADGNLARRLASEYMRDRNKHDTGSRVTRTVEGEIERGIDKIIRDKTRGIFD